MDCFELLTAQHAEVDALIARLEKPGGRNNDVIFAELADKLAAHAAIEEQIFYPAALTAQTEDRLHEAVEEHLAVKRLLADMLELHPADDEFKAKLAVLKENLEHHAHEEEEQELFPKLRRIFAAELCEALGGEMIAMFEALMEGEPRFGIPGETKEAAALD